MKLNLIAAAVLALVAVAPAHAKIDNGLNNPGNGELFLSVWDNNGTEASNDDRSYSLDLGTRLNDFASFAATPVEVVRDATYMLTFGPDATLTSWLAASNSLANVRWNVAGFDAVSQDRAAMTVAAGFSGSTQNFSQFRGWATGGAVHLAAVNAMGSHGTDNAVNVSSTATGADGAANSGDTSVWGTNVGGRIDFSNAGGLGDSLDFWMFSETVASGSSTTLVKQFQLHDDTAHTWTLASNGTLTYAAPIPEAETYALMLAGLGLVGFMARRRKAV
jgi:hypothetical protein